ncbi:NADPH:quinone reductase [Rhizobium sp. 16-449-1b]|uniref:NADPH:quinone reductase n=1 Tax=Rhizobium sp. 16-449-1b TaxID=2819989 RepID=UPI001ADC5B03|nr:NADPH:quinone reductase [Rhizobium sp. 16-449-1b]MBO9198605.1 NADPH:quinone reductase [Rhizobium sp. 16-449-1b]
MRAAFYSSTGTAKQVLHVGEQPTPTPEPGEVLVRIAVSGVNPSDVKARSGIGISTAQPLIIPHSDGAGVITAVGSGVDSGRIGQRVWIWNARWDRAFGTAAEFVALPASQAVPLPDNVAFEVGACLGIPWLTAWYSVHFREPTADDEWILVAGGAGSVGSYAVQLAKRAGYRVIATVSSEQKASIARSLGADAVINYRTDDVAAKVSAIVGGRGVDRIIEVDLAANAHLYTKILKPGGSVIVYGSSDWNKPLPLHPWLRHGVTVSLFIVYELPADVRRAAIAASAEVLADPSFSHQIAAIFPLDQVAEAHEAIESGGVIGNVLLSIDH